MARRQELVVDVARQRGDIDQATIALGRISRGVDQRVHPPRDDVSQLVFSADRLAATRAVLRNVCQVHGSQSSTFRQVRS